MEHWLEREIAQWVHPMKDRSDDPSHHEQTLYLWATSRSFHFMGILCLVSSKWSFICTIPQTEQHIPLPLIHQLWNIGWNEYTRWNQSNDLPHREKILYHWATSHSTEWWHSHISVCHLMVNSSNQPTLVRQCLSSLVAHYLDWYQCTKTMFLFKGTKPWTMCGRYWVQILIQL